jgi:hypothetical protein
VSDHPDEGEGPFPQFTCRSKAELQAAAEPRNSNVSNILSVTTLRTIDLAGKENPGLLFSRFCVERKIFFNPKLHHDYCKLGGHSPRSRKARNLGHPVLEKDKTGSLPVLLKAES